jgi:hypothetical protein
LNGCLLVAIVLFQGQTITPGILSLPELPNRFRCFIQKNGKDDFHVVPNQNLQVTILPSAVL